MIRVFVDESGNMGQSGDYFVLAAVVFKSDLGFNRVKRIIKREQLVSDDGKKWKNGKEEIKFTKLKFTEDSFENE